MLFLLNSILALYIAWSIGANDESMALLVGSKFLTLNKVVLLCAGVQVLGAMLFSSRVEETIGDLLMFEAGLSDVLSLLLSVATWLILGSIRKLPLSTTHSLIGAAIGLGILRLGLGGVNWQGVSRVLLGWVASPLAGLVGAMLLLKFMDALLARVRGLSQMLGIARSCGILLLLSSALVTFSRAGNDIANATAFLPNKGLRLTLSLGMAFGMIGLGRKVLRGVGQRLVELDPVMAISAQVAVATILFLATFFGFPLSGTHVLISAVVGVGLARRIWLNVQALKEILFAWVITFPGTALLSIALALVLG
jgi:PiT family inorganic phosphate transporter